MRLECAPAGKTVLLGYFKLPFSKFGLRIRFVQLLELTLGLLAKPVEARIFGQ
jgi:hypothetical protein